jgi:hypothetical protein
MSRKLCFSVSVLLMVSLSGCLYERATPEERQTGTDKIGTPESQKPVRIGQTTFDETVSTLGKPSRVSSNGRAVEYTYQPISGHGGFVSLGGPCGLCGVYPFTYRGHESLWLGFDGSGVLSRCASTRDGSPTDWEHFSAAAR